MFNTLIFLLWLTSSLPFSNSQFQTDFCEITCTRGAKTYMHTVCKRKNQCEAINGCTEMPSDDAFREDVVRRHNDYRNFIANGSNSQIYKHYENTGATNMNALTYDKELEYVARCYVNTCHEGDHDECRDVSRFQVGQNIYWGQTAETPDFMTEESVFFWFDELKHMSDVSWIHSFPGIAGFPQDGNQRGHFGQVVWAETRYVGCARVKKPNGKDGMLICKYGPTGNVITDPIYRMARDQDDIASDCTVRNRVWNALCGEVLPVSGGGGAGPTETPGPPATTSPSATDSVTEQKKPPDDNQAPSPGLPGASDVPSPPSPSPSPSPAPPRASDRPILPSPPPPGAPSESRPQPKPKPPSQHDPSPDCSNEKDESPRICDGHRKELLLELDQHKLPKLQQV